LLQEATPVERPLAPVLDLAKDLAQAPAKAPEAAIDEAAIAPAPSEAADLGLIDRLWSDLTVKALFVNGPTSVAVEREGVVQAVFETFRDETNLLEIVSRLVGEGSGMADFRLRDGSTGFVIFPPAAPSGPVLTLRRGEPGKATLEGLVSVGMIDAPAAELLRLCVRNGLSVLVSGPSGSGKTALLAALIRDLDPALRVVTVAGHREFRRPGPSKVELVAQAAAPFGMLMTAATRLEPGLIVLDGVPAQDTAALAEQLRGPAGIVASVASETMLLGLARVADVVVRTDRVGGHARVVTIEDGAGTAAFALEEGRLARGKPAFAATLQSRGLGDSLTKLLG
jgi:Flp pilus assembly CpaF family ATPase